MTRMRTLLGWLAIAIAVAISLWLDHVHYMTAFFNGFMGVLMAETVALVAVVIWLYRRPTKDGTSSSPPQSVHKETTT